MTDWHIARRSKWLAFGETVKETVKQAFPAHAVAPEVEGGALGLDAVQDVRAGADELVLGATACAGRSPSSAT